MRRGLLPRVLVAIAVLDVLFLALPTLVVLAASFTAGNIVTFPPQGLSLRWYVELVQRAGVSGRPGRSLQVGLVCTLLAIPAGTLAALALARFRLRFATGLQVYLLLPFTIPLVVSGIGLMLVFGPLGWLGPGLAGRPRLLRRQPAVHDLGGGRGGEPSRPRPRARRPQSGRAADPRLLHRHPAGGGARASSPARW